jgi:hypothetical protein
MSGQTINCVICGNTETDSRDINGGAIRQYTCPVCSQFCIQSIAIQLGLVIPDNQEHIVSGFIRNIHEFTGEVIDIDKNLIETFLTNGDPRVTLPKNIDDKLNMILFYIKRKTSYPSQDVEINTLYDYSICFAKDFKEFRFYLEHLNNLKLIQLSTSLNNVSKYFLTIKGFEYIAKLQEFNVHSNRCFVAMSFKNEYEALYSKAIKPAIEKAKYTPIRIDEENLANPDIEVNNDDRLIAEIRMSRFMIADFTAKSLNVYYEAGFAFGLGMKVIRCCEKNAIANGALPFDTRNRDHLSWEEGKEQEFLDALYYRIIYLLGEGSFKPE